MIRRVAILGGGVAGMSAAHELIERGFEVEVFERGSLPGGKARSIPVPGTSAAGRPELPGEHGFRFFPGFYRHLPDTMKRIPFADNPAGVFDNLVPTSEILLSREGGDDGVLLARFPSSLADIEAAIKGLFAPAEYGIPEAELFYFCQRLLLILSSCDERRLDEYERIPWWEFIGAASRSSAYQTCLARGLTRSLVAMRAEEASTRTVGAILIQLLLDLLDPFAAVDRVLNGPTNEVWIRPWLEYLRERGCTYRLGCRVTAIHCVDARITGVRVETPEGRVVEHAADYYLCCLPVEQVVPLLTPGIIAAAPSLADLHRLKTAWMNGIQFYLREDVPIARGHTLYIDSPWALTSISQGQFWRRPLEHYGDGAVRGVLSVDISDWDQPGVLYGLPARSLATREQIKDEVVAQIRGSLDPGRRRILDPDNIVAWFLDDSIVLPNPTGCANLEPLLLNTADSWRYRPEARTEISRFLVAADYVRTTTDLATMEGANEAARRAVNAILDDCGSSAPRCRLWPLEEPAVFLPAKTHDLLRFKLGLPPLLP